MEIDPTIGFAQTLMFKTNNPEEVDCYGGFLDRVGYSYLRPLDKKIELDQNAPQEINYAIAGLIRRKALYRALNSCKPFDADYFVHWYDIDLSWRIQLAGYEVKLIARSIAYHERRLTSGRSKLQYRNIFLNTRNRMMTLIKNYSLRNLLRYIPLLMAFETAEVIALLKKRPDHASATIRGMLWTLRNLRKIWKKRVFIQRYVRRVSDWHIITKFVRTNPLQLYRELQRHYPTVN